MLISASTHQTLCLPVPPASMALLGDLALSSLFGAQMKCTKIPSKVFSWQKKKLWILVLRWTSPSMAKPACGSKNVFRKLEILTLMLTGL